MDKTFFQTYYRYNFWANRQVWECVVALPEEKFREDLNYSIGSIYIQCFHTMSIEHWWFRYLSTGELSFLDETDYPDRAAIRIKWDAQEQEILAYIDSLTPQEMEREVRPPFWDEGEGPIQVWEAMLQVANHSTDHRAQTLAGLHRLGAPTIGQDVLNYYFARQKSDLAY